MKIRIRELRKVIREEVRRLVALNEGMWGEMDQGDPTQKKIQGILQQNLSVKAPLLTKDSERPNTYKFNIMNLPDEEVSWLASEFKAQGASVTKGMGMMYVTMTSGVSPDAEVFERNPAGASVWDEEA